MNEQELKLLKSIENEAKSYIAKHGYVPYQITISDHEYKIYKKIIRQGKRASVQFQGVKWSLNIQCCSVIVTSLDQLRGEV